MSQDNSIKLLEEVASAYNLNKEQEVDTFSLVGIGTFSLSSITLEQVKFLKKEVDFLPMLTKKVEQNEQGVQPVSSKK